MRHFCVTLALATSLVLGSCASGLPSWVPGAASTQAGTTYTAWDPVVSPNYYRVVGPAVVSEELAPGDVLYGDLDLLGRATGTRAQVTNAMMTNGIARERKDTSSISPSGWGENSKVEIALPNGGTYHGYFWNRSHLLAKSLGGDEVIQNLITGTRMQNVGANDGGGGMAWCETTCRDWLEAHPDGSVYYAATPVYEGSELVARSVLVDMRSSDGSIDQRVEVYNAALGFSIDYATGAFFEQR